MVGFVNVGFLIYNVVTIAFTHHADPQPTYPARLRNGLVPSARG